MELFLIYLLEDELEVFSSAKTVVEGGAAVIDNITDWKVIRCCPSLVIFILLLRYKKRVYFQVECDCALSLSAFVTK